MPTMINETAAAYRQAEIRLGHVERLLTLAQDELRNTPVLVGDAELLNAMRQTGELKRNIFDLIEAATAGQTVTS